jgi:outer membrane protein assembly factor BamB
VALVVLSSVSASAVAGQADAFQQDAAHDGFIADAGLSAPLTQDWSITLPSAISYPLIVNGMVYVTTADDTLYALNQVTGSTVWSRGVGGTYAAPGLAYDGGQVYVVNSSGLLTAFDAATGSIAWSMQLPGQYLFSSAPTAFNGIVYTGGAGSGGTV